MITYDLIALNIAAMTLYSRLNNSRTESIYMYGRQSEGNGSPEKA